MPVIGSRRVLNCAMLHDGVTRRSEVEFGEMMKMGTSRAVCIDILKELGICHALPIKAAGPWWMGQGDDIFASKCNEYVAFCGDGVVCKLEPTDERHVSSVEAVFGAQQIMGD